MAFDLNRFLHRELDEHYGAHDNEKTEAFLKSKKETADRAGTPMPVNTGCPSLCAAPGTQLGFRFRVQ